MWKCQISAWECLKVLNAQQTQPTKERQVRFHWNARERERDICDSKFTSLIILIVFVLQWICVFFCRALVCHSVRARPTIARVPSREEEAEEEEEEEEEEDTYHVRFLEVMVVWALKKRNPAKQPLLRNLLHTDFYKIPLTTLRLDLTTVSKPQTPKHHCSLCLQHFWQRTPHKMTVDHQDSRTLCLRQTDLGKAPLKTPVTEMRSQRASWSTVPSLISFATSRLHKLSHTMRSWPALNLPAVYLARTMGPGSMSLYIKKSLQLRRLQAPDVSIVKDDRHFRKPRFCLEEVEILSHSNRRKSVGTTGANLLCVPFLHRWPGSWRQQIQEFARTHHEANPSPGAHSEAPGRSSGAGRQQHPPPENQDSQHKLN